MNAEPRSAWVDALVSWYRAHARPFPWRNKVDPYYTWVCEVMSQQTILSVVLPRFEAFIAKLPTVHDLAQCPEPVLRELWAGLGYYARARNLQKGACYIRDVLSCNFPTTYEGWLAVPGCGPYTASVIASICFREPVACVDGNVIRVVSRLLALENDVWSTRGLTRIQEFSNRSIPHEAPGDYNQAVMELGATVCRKQNPRCDVCPVAVRCEARKLDIVEKCPPVKPRPESTDVPLLGLVLSDATTGKIGLLTRRTGFLAGTVGFPLLRLKEAEEMSEVLRRFRTVRDVRQVEFAGEFGHTITRHRIRGRVLTITVSTTEFHLDPQLSDFLGTPRADDWQWLPQGEVSGGLSSSLDSKIWKAGVPSQFQEPRRLTLF